MEKNFDTRRQKFDRILRLLKRPNARIVTLVQMLHPSEVAQVLEQSDTEMRMRIVRELPPALISEALSEMDEDMRPANLLLHLKPEIAASIIRELYPDDAADLLNQLPEYNQDEILQYLPESEETVISQLLEYDEDTAGGLMNPDLVKVREDMTRMEALREIMRLSEDLEEFYMIYVVDAENHLVGYLNFGSLFRSKNQVYIQEVMNTDVISVYADMDQEEVARVVSQYNLPTLPVVDKENHLLGCVTFDDVLDVMQEETTEDMLSFAGVSEYENLRGDWANAVKSRIPWLIVNTLTAALAGLVLSHYESIIVQIAVLTAYMPIIAGVAGNSATQTLAVTIRRISTEGVEVSKVFPVILKEVSVGLTNGILLGTIVSMVALATNQNPLIGLVIFLAMFLNMFLAGLVGSSIPLLLEKMEIDPAVASSILITACTDIIGFSLLFGLASAILL